MARIAGVDLPREKRVEVGLTYIYGIGRDDLLRYHDWRPPASTPTPGFANLTED